LDKLIASFAVNEFTRRVQARLKLSCSLEKKLKSMGCDMVYFVEPSAISASLQCLNYIITVWDDCHRDFPEFPEVRTYGEFHRREFSYKNYLAPAYLILVDSEELRARIHSRYGIDNEQMVVMPFAPNPMLDNVNTMSMEEVLAHYGLEPGYFFYPAQFWAHKNHVRILEALVTLRDKGGSHRLVLVGGDKGNLTYIHDVISKLNLYNQVAAALPLRIRLASSLSKGTLPFYALFMDYFGSIDLE
jgi:glycosyltransferase involved in cell wall biosynthesis